MAELNKNRFPGIFSQKTVSFVTQDSFRTADGEWDSNPPLEAFVIPGLTTTMPEVTPIIIN
jgi:hypothetical protein